MPTDPKLRILALHAYYRARGGEDTSFETETSLLRSAGHRVEILISRNEDLTDKTALHRIRTTVWSEDTYHRVHAAIRGFSPDVIYLNNIWPTLSASGIASAADLGIPIVMAVRNYRLACLNGLLFRDGADCDSCTSGGGGTWNVPWHGLLHRCYGGTVAASAAALAANVSVRQTIRRHSATMMFAPVSEHVAMFLRGLGVPQDRIRVKPNAVFPVPDAVLRAGRETAVFVGRLSAEKGIRDALRAFTQAGVPGDRFHVIGDGPEAPLLADYRGTGELIHHPGLDLPSVYALLARSSVSLIPSTSQDTFGRVAAESLACGTPPIVTRRGGLPNIPEQGTSGWIVPPGDVDGMARLIRQAQDPEVQARMRPAARQRFDSTFAPGQVLNRLVRILSEAADLRPVPAGPTESGSRGGTEPRIEAGSTGPGMEQ